MKKIEVLGPGCLKCHKTAELVQKVIDETGADAEMEHVTDVQEVIRRGIMMTPAVMVDGEVKIEGKVPSADEIKAIL